MKERITYEEFLQLTGLERMASDLSAKIEGVRQSMYEVIGVHPVFADKEEVSGWISDLLYSDTGLDAVLSNLGIAVDAKTLPEIGHYSEDATTAKCGDEMKGEHHKVTDKAALVTCTACEAYLRGFGDGVSSSHREAGAAT